MENKENQQTELEKTSVDEGMQEEENRPTQESGYVFVSSASKPTLREDQLPENLKLIKPWGYFGYFWLFSIPFAGFIMALIYAFSDDKYNRRYFARGYLLMFVALLVIAIPTAIILSLTVFKSLAPAAALLLL